MKNENAYKKKYVKPALIAVGLEGVGFARLIIETAARRSGLEKGESFGYCAVSYASDVLNLSEADCRIQLDNRAENCEEAVKAAREELRSEIHGAEFVYLVASLGDEKTSGTVLELAKLARERGKFTVAVVTEPFEWEGEKRVATAKLALERLTEYVDSVIDFPYVGDGKDAAEAYKAVERDLVDGIVALHETAYLPSVINTDEEDLKVVCRGTRATLSVLRAEGEDPIVAAVKKIHGLPHLKEAVSSADGVVLVMNGGMDLSLTQLNIAVEEIREMIISDANVIIGADIKQRLNERAEVVVLACKKIAK